MMPITLGKACPAMNAPSGVMIRGTCINTTLFVGLCSVICSMLGSVLARWHQSEIACPSLHKGKR